MLEKIILINSANFNFLEINLEKDLFFLGDNGSGKTTLIRAIHYLFSGDVTNLGIPSDKDGFKEYYFKYQNSYIIYTFNDFFIFMYKTGGEIVKLFSKQKFDISRIVDDNNKLYEFSDIRKYIKLANLKVTARGVDDYRKIIYGHNKKYLDFKLTYIQSYKTFIGLFNQIFNIDKSIIDSKSIKKAIQTTLNYEKTTIEFDYKFYLDEINKFQLDYKFFRDFENQKQTIDNASKLKDELLGLEDAIEKKKGEILFRSEEEKKILNKLNQQLKDIDSEVKKIQGLKELKKSIFEKCEIKIKNITDNLTLEIREIEQLQEKFTKENILSNQNIADRLNEIKGKLDKLRENHTRLKEGFDTEINSIEKEIEELIYKRDTKLLRERNDREYNEIEQLKDSLKSDIEKKELKFELDREEFELKINAIDKELEEIQLDIEKYQNAFSDDRNRYDNNINSLKQQKVEREDAQIEIIREEQKKIFDIEQSLNKISVLFNKKTEEYINNKKDREREYLKEKNRLDKKIKKYENMISFKENSFKEFLNQEVDGWEYELYPILDDELLDKSVDELKPKLLDSSNIFSIKIETTNLKKILTQSEAEKKIQEINLKEKSLKESYELSLSSLEESYERDSSQFEIERTSLKQDIESKKSYILNIKESTDIQEWFNEEKAKLDNSFKILEEKYSKKIENLNLVKQEKIKTKKSLEKNIEQDKNSSKEEIKLLKKNNRIKNRKIKERFDNWLKDEQGKITKNITQKEEEKYNITKNEQLKKLEEDIKNSEKEYNKSRDAKKFLKEYEESKEKLTSLNRKKSELLNIKNKSNIFKDRLNKKINIYKNQIKNIEDKKIEIREESNKLNLGVKRFKNLEIDFHDISKKQSDEYLFKLIERYKSFKSENRDKKINFKIELDKLNSLKNNHYEIDIYFKFDEYDNNNYISQTPNIIRKLDEIIEFKNKKIEIIKQTSHSNFANFTNKLPSKIKVFSDIESKFAGQIKKIRKNLSYIDFGVIKDIRIDTKMGDKKSLAKHLETLERYVINLSTLLKVNSLWYDQRDVIRELNKLENKFKTIKNELRGDAISLIDTIDLSLSFNENGKRKTEVSQIKNESSTGGSILLKIALAISILELFVEENKTPFFLIVDEVSRLHSNNQEKLRKFANSKGFGIIFVTPEPTYSKPDLIKYYKFEKNSDNEFEVIELNR